MPHTPLIAPSLLAADFAHLGRACQRAENGGADWLHLDVMDGNFVPNISFGIDVIRAAKRSCNLTLDVHLMVNDPAAYLEAFKVAGADRFTFHVECNSDHAKLIQRIKQAGLKVGLALNPETPAESILPYLDCLDQIVIMTVNPGFGGQSYIPQDAKIKAIRAAAPDHLRIVVDGGIDLTTAPLAYSAGADVFIAGTALFKAADMQLAITKMREGLT